MLTYPGSQPTVRDRIPIILNQQIILGLLLAYPSTTRTYTIISLTADR